MIQITMGYKGTAVVIDQYIVVDQTINFTSDCDFKWVDCDRQDYGTDAMCVWPRAKTMEHWLIFVPNAPTGYIELQYVEEN